MWNSIKKHFKRHRHGGANAGEFEHRHHKHGHILNPCQEHCVKAHFQKFKNWGNGIDCEYKNLTKLNFAKPGLYKFIFACCLDESLGRRLLEMGFVPGEQVNVISNTGSKGSVMVEIKGSKLALSNKIADNILIKGE
jgi:Fe2+ transport system protein FeoA